MHVEERSQQSLDLHPLEGRYIPLHLVHEELLNFAES
jgi:hypothetical protein